MPDRKTLNEDLFYRGSSANLPRLHTCENKVPFWDFGQFAVTLNWLVNSLSMKDLLKRRWGECPLGVMAKVVDCEIPLGKLWNEPPYCPSYGLNSTTTVLLGE